MPASKLYTLNTAEWTFDHSAAVQLQNPGEPYTGKCPCYLIDHPEGTVLFDTGVSHEMQADPANYGPHGAPHMVEFVEALETEPDGTPVAQLAELGYAPEEIDYVVQSHLHVDHAGNLDAFPESTIVVHKEELRYAFWPDGVQRLFYLQGDVSVLRSGEYDVRAITGEYDVFGDGSVVAFPTPGHTPGHQSLLVELGGRTVILTADVAMSRAGFENELVASFAWSLEESIDSIGRVRDRARVQDADCYVHHDPEDIERLPEPPAALE